MPGVLGYLNQVLKGACGWDQAATGYRAPDVEIDGVAGKYAWLVKDQDARATLVGLLYELQHPKQLLYANAVNIVVPAGGVYLTPWIDVSGFRNLGYYVANTGANVWTTTIVEMSDDPAGAAPFTWACTTATAIPAGVTWWSQYDIPVNLAGWTPSAYAPTTFRYWRLGAIAALGTTGRVCLVGSR